MRTRSAIYGSKRVTTTERSCRLSRRRTSPPGCRRLHYALSCRPALWVCGSNPRFIPARSVDRWHLAVRHAQVDRELTAVMDLVVEKEPDPVLARHRAHLLRSDHEVNVLFELGIGCGGDEIAEIVVRLLQRGEELVPIVGRLGRAAAAGRRSG